MDSRSHLRPGSWVTRFASLDLTLILLLASMVLVFAGTLAQVRMGIEPAVDAFFRSWWISIPIPGLDHSIPLIPAGRSIGLLLFLNLAAAWRVHFRPNFRQAGIWLSHASIMMLLIGEFFTGFFQEEWVMPLDEGASSTYVQAYYDQELALVHTDNEKGEIRTLAIDMPVSSRTNTLPLENLPFEVEVIGWVPHAILGRDSEITDRLPRGIGYTEETPPTAPGQVAEPVAILKLSSTSQNDQVVLLHPRLEPIPVPGYPDWTLSLRFARHPLPFRLTLDDFVHETYEGTEIPKHFASKLQLTDLPDGTPRQIEISMNAPLRYQGWTFYQQSFANEDTTSILHAVKNPVRALPYVACVIGAFGLLLHVILHRGSQMKSRERRNPQALQIRPAKGWLLYPAVGTLVLAFILGKPSSEWHDIDLKPLLTRPVLHEGRVKPLDTVAQNSLLLLHGRSSLRGEEGKMDYGSWMAEVLFDPQAAFARPVLRVENPEILSALEMEEKEAPVDLSINDLDPHLMWLTREAQTFSRIPAGDRDRYQQDLLDLFNRCRVFFSLPPSWIPDPEALQRIQSLTRQPNQPDLRFRQAEQFRAWQNAASFLVLPPDSQNPWRTPAQDLFHWMETGLPPSEDILTLAQLTVTATGQDKTPFEDILDTHTDSIQANTLESSRRVLWEYRFNRLNLFGTAMMLYVVIGTSVLLSWLLPSPKWRAINVGLGAGTFAIHSLALLWRMLLEQRPPVTNLYSSAVFIGWAIAGGCLMAEWKKRDGMAGAGLAVGGFISLLIAHHLSLSGDTKEVMRAVLDSNFWLATHVVTVTLGYAATFVAGLIALVAVLRHLAGRRWQASDESLVVGALMIGLLLSFVGTVLGGIWADQSWGRFWGWDPKENGALLIVLWNAWILHARLSGRCRIRGVMACALVGNIVTSWSWFGTNLLSIGLHSYGFTSGSFRWLVIFWLINLGTMLLALAPPLGRRSESAA